MRRNMMKRKRDELLPNTRRRGKHGDLTRRVILVSCRLCNVSRVSLFGSEYMHAHSQVGSSTFNALSINRPFSRAFGAQDWQIKDEEMRQGGVREEIKNS